MGARLCRRHASGVGEMNNAFMPNEKPLVSDSEMQLSDRALLGLILAELRRQTQWLQAIQKEVFEGRMLT